MEYENFEQLKADVGLVKIEECTQQENADLAEMEQNGQPLPDNIRKTANKGSGGQPCYVRLHSKVSSDKEELYVLMRISKDLHFIKILLGITFTLAIVAFLLSMIISR